MLRPSFFCTFDYFSMQEVCSWSEPLATAAAATFKVFLSGENWGLYPANRCSSCCGCGVRLRKWQFVPLYPLPLLPYRHCHPLLIMPPGGEGGGRRKGGWKQGLFRCYKATDDGKWSRRRRCYNNDDDVFGKNSVDEEEEISQRGKFSLLFSLKRTQINR